MPTISSDTVHSLAAASSSLAALDSLVIAHSLKQRAATVVNDIRPVYSMSSMSESSF